MTNAEVSTAEVYQTMDEITFRGVAYMILQTSVRTFCGDIAEEVLALDDQAAIQLALDLDTKPRDDENQGDLAWLSTRYDIQTPRAYEQDPELANRFAMNVIRKIVAGQKAAAEYQTRFPDQDIQTVAGQDALNQAQVLTGRVVEEYLGRRMPEMPMVVAIRK